MAAGCRLQLGWAYRTGAGRYRCVLTIEHTSSNWLPDYASDINYFFTNICSIDFTGFFRVIVYHGPHAQGS